MYKTTPGRMDKFTTIKGDLIQICPDLMVCNECKQKTDKIKSCKAYAEKPSEVIHGGKCPKFNTL